jgi:hypothetical protein
MALKKTVIYKEAGDIELTDAYHRIEEVNIGYANPAHPSGDVNMSAEDTIREECRVSVQVFANSGVRHDMATPIMGYQFEFPIASLGTVVDQESLFASAYSYIKTGQLSQNQSDTVFYSGAVDV